MIKVIATDLDGTLFYPKRKVRLLTSKNRRFLKNMIESGRRIAVVSGRNIEIGERIEKKIADKIDMIACNGAFVSLSDGRKIMHGIDHQLVRKVYDELKHNEGIKAWLFMTSKYPLIITYHDIKKREYAICFLGMRLQGVYREKYITGDEALEKALNDPECQFFKVMPYFGYHSIAKEIAYNKTIEYEKRYGKDLEVLWSNDSIEMMKKGINKANALKTYIDMLKFNESEVAVIGDSGNDIPMFQEFYENSFVMSHAPETVRKEAKTVIEMVADVEDYL